MGSAPCGKGEEGGGGLAQPAGGVWPARPRRGGHGRAGAAGAYAGDTSRQGEWWPRQVSPCYSVGQRGLTGFEFEFK
jgi:hypothetical protein